jgi:chemotaxis protein CheZ
MNDMAVDIDSLFADAQAGNVALAKAPTIKIEALERTQILVAPVAGKVDVDAGAYDVFQRIGSITRKLHDALRELGYDKTLEANLNKLPDARDRLTYIARLTGEAAEKVLNATESARNTQDEVAANSKALCARWKAASAGAAAGDAQLVAETTEFLGNLSMMTDQTNSHLTEIMMAQDFHDLTGQVIRKVVDIAQTLEVALVKLLLETSPPEKRTATKAENEGLEGPVVNAEGRTDVVSDQGQVDDLLASMGF